MGLKNIGAMWLKDGKNGKKFMTGQIEINGQKHSFMVFKNEKKEAAKQPDYRIVVSEDEQQGSTPDTDGIPF